MPPRGTTGRSSSTGARGPTGPQGQARSSPAGAGGGRAGSVSRTSTGARGPTGPKGQARTSPAGGRAGAVSRSSKSSFDRFQDRYPGGLKSMPVRSIPPPMPGGLGPAGNVLRGAAASARGVLGRVTGSTAAAANKAKQVAKIEKQIPRLERMKQSEAVRLGKPSQPGKIQYKRPQRTLSEIRQLEKPFRGYKTFSRIERGIDEVTDALGFGTGTVARAKAAATIAGSQEVGRAATERAMNTIKSNTKDKNTSKKNNMTTIMKTPQRSPAPTRSGRGGR
jgi:hypothetical protein